MDNIGERVWAGCRYIWVMSMNTTNSSSTPSHSVTIDPLSFAVATATSPEFIRLPRPGQRDPIFGLSRSYLNYLVLPCKENNYRPSVKSSVLRRRGARTGVRLINVDSLRAFVMSRQEPDATPNAAPTVG